MHMLLLNSCNLMELTDNITYLLAGRDLSCDSFSSPILSFNPNFKSGIPERKHFIRIFPVTSQRSTLPTKAKRQMPIFEILLHKNKHTHAKQMVAGKQE